MNNVNSFVNKYYKSVDGVNFIKLINEEDYVDNKLPKKLSFTIKYQAPKTFFNYLGVSKTLEYYYGLSAKLSLETVSNLIISDTLIDNNKLKIFLNDNADYFILDNLNLLNKYGEALFARTILGISLHYGYFFKCPNLKIYNDIQEFSKTKNYHLYLKFDENNHVIAIKGRPSNDFIKNFPYYIKDGFYQTEGVPLKDIYDNNTNYKISLIDKTYYSGVLPRLKQIIRINDEFYNPNIISYMLVVEQTTYAFVESFDNTKLLEYDILKPYKEILIDFNKKEFELENKYIHNNFSLDSVNKYLNETANNNNIAVSANIITNDNYLLYGLRSNSSIDKHTLYCSVNGQAEIMDENVKYYYDSAYEDQPTINIHSKQRIDFKNEFSREMVAELSLTGFEKNYEYLGISILGIKSEEFSPTKERRLHFNILAEHKSEYSFKQINDGWKNSLESFENNKVLGLNINSYKTVKSCVFSEIVSFLKTVATSKDIITIILAFMFSVFLMGGIKFSSLMDYIDLIISIILFILFIINLVNNILYKKEIYNITKRKTYIVNQSIDKLIISTNKSFIKKTKINAKFIYSPIALLLTYIHINKL